MFERQTKKLVKKRNKIQTQPLLNERRVTQKQKQKTTKKNSHKKKMDWQSYFVFFILYILYESKFSVNNDKWMRKKHRDKEIF